MCDRTSGGGAPWFADGLRFTCETGCAACCVNHGDNVYVYLEEVDVARLAAHLGIAREEFLSKHTIVEDRFVALRMDEPQCLFLDGSRCSVYPARPVQCRTFPFWNEYVETRESWDALKTICPGIDQGKLHAAEDIRFESERRKLE